MAEAIHFVETNPDKANASVEDLEKSGFLKEIWGGRTLLIKRVKPEELMDRRYLDEMQKSGFFDQLWGVKRGG